MKIPKLTVCLFLVSLSIFATVSVVGATNESSAAVLFLLIEPGARASALGESYVALAEDAMASYYNPAALSGQSRRELTFTHTNWLPAFAQDLYYEFIGFSQPVKGWGNFGANITFLSLGEQTRTSEDGTVLGNFNSYDIAGSLSYGADISKKTSAGITMKVIRSNLAEVGAGKEKGKGIGTSFAADFGLLWKPGIAGLNIGAAVHNLGPKIAYIDAEQADPLPLNFVVGTSYKVLDTEFNDILVTADVYKPLVTNGPFLSALIKGWYDEPLKEEIKQIDLHAGIEYSYSSFLALRAGYSYDSDGDLRTPTFGIGLSYNWMRLDIAYVPAQNTPLQDNTRFSMTVNF